MVSSEGTEDFWTNANDRNIMKMVKLPNNNCKYLDNMYCWDLNQIACVNLEFIILLFYKKW